MVTTDILFEMWSMGQAKGAGERRQGVGDGKLFTPPRSKLCEIGDTRVLLLTGGRLSLAWLNTGSKKHHQWPSQTRALMSAVSGTL